MRILQTLWTAISTSSNWSYTFQTPEYSGMSVLQNQPSYGSVDYNIESDLLKPRSRHALLHVPATYDKAKATPLIVAIHGKAQPPREFEDHTQFSNPEYNKDAIVVYPEGIKVSQRTR